MNQRMKKLRDEMANKLFLKPNKTMEEDFKSGFNAAHDLLMKDVSGLIEAFEDLLERHNYKGEDEWHIKALAEWHEKHGGEK